MKRYFTILLAIGIILGFLSMFVLPNADDWFFLKYLGMSFDKDANTLLGADGLYWRPVQEIVFYFLCKIPNTFPFVHHLIVTVFNTAAAFLISLIVGKFVGNNRIAFLSALYFLLCTMSMSNTFSIDSVAQVFATFCGILATWVFISSSSKLRYVAWIMLCFIGSLTKETGLPWFFCVPIILYLYEYRQSGKKLLFERKLITSLTINCLIAIFFVILYFGIRLTFFPDSLDFNQIDANQNPNNSYKLTPIVFIKNILILFVAPIVPVDTSALIYGYDMGVGILTIILSLLWVLGMSGVVLKNFHGFDIKQVFIGLILLIIIASPSLVTRAGELSAYPVIFVLSLLGGICLSKIHIPVKKGFVLILLFFLTTIITDAHKYYLIYRAGKVGNEMAEEILEKTKVVPYNVLIITVDDFSDKKSGAMHVVPGTSYHNGDAVKWLYNFQYPKKSKNIIFRPSSLTSIESQIDSILKAEDYKTYNCVWINNNKDIKVINVK